MVGVAPVHLRRDILKEKSEGLPAGLSSPQKQQNPQLALLVSCVGRKIVLGNRIEEEIEAVKEVFGPNLLVCGFYSYGEISPTLNNVACELHNQTMTITTLYES